jgi:hypothetical protein
MSSAFSFVNGRGISSSESTTSPHTAYPLWALQLSLLCCIAEARGAGQAEGPAESSPTADAARTAYARARPVRERQRSSRLRQPILQQSLPSAVPAGHEESTALTMVPCARYAAPAAERSEHASTSAPGKPHRSPNPRLVLCLSRWDQTTLKLDDDTTQWATTV